METIRLCKGCGAVLPAHATGDSCADCAAKTGRATGTIVISPAQFLPTTTASEAGRRFGAYQLIRSLGQGGMGAVYEAEETESGRRVALKVLSQALDSKDARQRFLREGRLAASVNHPNSVYIFGTEEVEGQPVITMELVAGGTLQERVRQKGPMPVAEAIEAILNVIAGLEAAAAVGVLHRDVKPSNCFIEADGTVKIGDFGLSKSSTGKAETELTMAESFLGTPAFSSPEQLRGDEMTITSDIYAVGVTLYFILTARLPFESENMVRVLAMALEKQPDPPVKWRPDLPAPLDRAVLKCLAKRPEQRFQNYAELRRALAPFSKVAPSPATLTLRLAAGVADKIAVPVAVTVLYLTLVQLGLLDPESAVTLWAGGSILLGIVAARILYFAVPEHLWGASPGKLICDLRVVDASRAFPSWPKALARASIFTVVPLLPDVLYRALVSGGQSLLSRPWEFGGNGFIVTALMFVAARRANGFAALHDWLTGTRVIERSAYQDARPVAEKIDDAAEAPAAAQRFGVFAVLEKLRESDDEEWLLGLDAPLGRKVWIRRWKSEAPPPVEAARRNLHRSGRLRWLNGRRGLSENWDAYEAPTGQPFLELIRKRQRWGDVRLWLLDLTQELDASLKDGSAPPFLSLDRLWITRSGRAKILDFTPPVPLPAAAAPDGQPPLIADDLGCRRFLRQAACSALEGSPLNCEDAHYGETATAPLPPHARAFFHDLPDFLDLTEAAGRLRSLAFQPAAVTRRRRLLTMAASVAPVLSIILFSAVVLLISDSLAAKFGDSAKLEQCIRRWQKLQEKPSPSDAAERDALEVYISAFFNKAGVKPDGGPMRFQATLDPEWAKLATAIKARHPAPTRQELAQAETTLAPLLEVKKPEIKFTPEKERQLEKIAAGAALLLPFFAILSALLVRRGIVARVGRIEIITRNGAPARRWRLVCRSLLVWGLLVAAASLFLAQAELPCWVAAMLFLGGVVAAVATPERTPADRIMGTWLAPE